MTHALLFGAFLAALSYVLIPGPAFLALLGIGAGQGRKAGALGVIWRRTAGERPRRVDLPDPVACLCRRDFEDTVVDTEAGVQHILF